MPFGQYESAPPGTDEVATGEYLARIKACRPRTNASGQPEQGKNGKVRAGIVFEVEDGLFVGKRVKRTTDIAFGRSNENSEYAFFAKTLSAATGIPCGDDRLKNEVEEQDVVDRLVTIVVVRKGAYSNVEDVRPFAVGASRLDDEPLFDEDEHVRPTTFLRADQSRAIMDIAVEKGLTKMGIERAVGRLTIGRTIRFGEISPEEADRLIAKMRGAKTRPIPVGAS